MSILTDGDELEVLFPLPPAEIFRTCWWELIAGETKKYETLTNLMKDINDSFISNKPTIAEYQRYQGSLYVNDGVVMYQVRLVAPTFLRKASHDNMHAAKQGVSSM